MVIYIIYIYIYSEKINNFNNKVVSERTNLSYKYVSSVCISIVINPNSLKCKIKVPIIGRSNNAICLFFSQGDLQDRPPKLCSCLAAITLSASSIHQGNETLKRGSYSFCVIFPRLTFLDGARVQYYIPISWQQGGKSVPSVHF